MAALSRLPPVIFGSLNIAMVMLLAVAIVHVQPANEKRRTIYPNTEIVAHANGAKTALLRFGAATLS